MDDRVARLLQEIATEGLSGNGAHSAPAMQRLCQVAVRDCPPPERRSAWSQPTGCRSWWRPPTGSSTRSTGSSR